MGPEIYKILTWSTTCCMWRVEKVSRTEEKKKLIYLPSDKKNTRQTQRHSAKNRHVDIRQLVCRPLGVCRVSVSGTR